MKRWPTGLLMMRLAPCLWVAAGLGASSLAAAASPTGESRLPWREAGLSERAAAAHLLNRFTFGPRPREIDQVVEIGLEVWLERQLGAALDESVLEQKLSPLDTLSMSGGEIADAFPFTGRVVIQLANRGLLDQTGKRPQGMRGTRGVLERFYRENGYRWQQELLVQLMEQKLLRAVYSENQLQEVLTDFWFNHFNVALGDNQARVYILSYERDVIRPGALSDFRSLLQGVAQHPAMLQFLDNANSVAERGARTMVDSRSAGRRPPGQAAMAARRRNTSLPARPEGINENYARELLELHTLGVDGGYSQDDVINVARAFTGWTVLPPRDVREAFGSRRGGFRGGFARGGASALDGGFVFRGLSHDADKKKVLGKRLPAGRGLEDGLEVLDLLAQHPSTAQHLAHKLAVRFVSDEPPQALVKRLAATFTKSRGDIVETIRELAYSREFWSAEARGAKIKSPLEVASSALRATGAELREAMGVVEWIARMGQPLYNYSAPTGYPDRADHWVNAGALLNRMNFGLQLATGRIRGVEIDLPALLGGREPESVEAALDRSWEALLPERPANTETTRVLAMIGDPALAEKLSEVAEPASASDSMGQDIYAAMFPMPVRARPPMPPASGAREPPSQLAQVMGVILGLPEFQRR